MENKNFVGCQKSYNMGIGDVNNWLRKQPFYQNRNKFVFLGRYPAGKETVKKTVKKLSSTNTKRYLKLYNGDVYDVDSNTILSREVLHQLLSI